MYYDHKGRPNQPGITDELIRAKGTGRKQKRARAAADGRGDKRNHLQKTIDANRDEKRKRWDLFDGRNFSMTDRSWLKANHPDGKNFGKVKAVRRG